MLFHIYKSEEGNTVLEFDLEGIDYFMGALLDLRNAEPGTGVQTPTVSIDDQGTPESVESLILLRAEEPGL